MCPHVPTCPHMCPQAKNRAQHPPRRCSYDLDMQYTGLMEGQMLTEDVLKKNFEHPHVVVGLILIMFYLVETGVSRAKWAQPETRH